MLHQPAETFVPVPTSVMSTSSPEDVKRAKAWIAGARKCGLSVFPWLSFSASNPEQFRGGVMQFGQDMDGPNDYGAATKRFLRHPAADLDRTIPKGLIYELLCVDFGVNPEDRTLCDKVNVRLKAEIEERERWLAERRLLKLCRRAEAMLATDLAAANHDSDVSDAFMSVEKPKRPTVAYDALPCGHDCTSNLSSHELRKRLRTIRALPKERRSFVAARSISNLKTYIEQIAAWEREITALEKKHGVISARRAASKACDRTREYVAALAEIPATTAVGSAAKCRVMKAVLKAGYGHHDEFEQLALSIYDDGDRLHGKPSTAARPPRSDVGHPAHI